MTDHIETALPCLIFTASVPGDAPALGRLLIDEDQGVDQWWATWGIESNKDYTFTDSTGSGALYYEAESRTAMGGSAIAAGPTGASGAGSNVMRNTSLALFYEAILSTQATGGGAHLTHVGTFRMFARVQIPTANQGTVSVGLEWGDGDFRRYTRNATTVLLSEWRATWRLVDLGLVTIPKVVAGTQRWEGRVIASSTAAGDDIDVDWLMLIPADVASGEVTAVDRVSTPTAYSAHDEFDQTAGALTGKTAPVGGVWAGAGDVTDFAVETSGHTAQRTEISDASVNAGRFAISGAAAFGAQLVTVDVRLGATIQDTIWGGPVARYTDTNNFVTAVLVPFDSGTGLAKLIVYQYVAGAQTTLAISTGGGAGSAAASVLYDSTAWYSLSMMVTAVGRVFVWIRARGEDFGTPLLTATSTALATGGTLATGKVGFLDVYTSTVAVTRNYDNFAAWVPASDAAIFASQSLEIRHDRVLREDSGGTLWVTPSSYIGDYLRPPPAGAEGHSARVIVKASRDAPGTGPDAGIDDISARLFVTPRYL